MIYVDELINWNWRIRKQDMGKSCHLFADDLEELISFAAKLGLKKEWVQEICNGSTLNHYDLTRKKRKLAVENGAKEVDKYFIVNFIKSIRKGE